MDNKVVLISDIPGYGKVALNAQLPILSAQGFDLFNLPTALVSNTLNFGRFEILDTTDYMARTLEVWEELGFSFQGISIGFVISEAQLELIRHFVDNQRQKQREQPATPSTSPVYVALDPIMGDRGRLYNGITLERVPIMREVAKLADLITPNLTEATYLTDYLVGRTALTSQEAQELAQRLYDLTGATTVITSVQDADSGEHAIVVHDGEHITFLPYQQIPGQVPGTGDIFSALLLGKLLKHRPLIPAVRQTADQLSYLLEQHYAERDATWGIPLERYLSELDY